MGRLQTSEAESKDNEWLVFIDYLLVQPSLSGILPTLVSRASVHHVGVSCTVLVAFRLVLACCTKVVFVNLKTMCPAVSSDSVDARTAPRGAACSAGGGLPLARIE